MGQIANTMLIEAIFKIADRIKNKNEESKESEVPTKGEDLTKSESLTKTEDQGGTVYERKEY